MTQKSQNPTLVSRLIFAFTIGCIFLLLWNIPAHAAEHGISILADGTEEVVSAVNAIALALVRLMFGAGGALFVVGVARGAFDGVLGNVLGSPGAVQTGMLRMIGVVGVFLLLLVGFGASSSFVDMMTEHFIRKGILTPLTPGSVAVHVPNGTGNLSSLASVVGEALRIVLFLIGAWFLLTMLVAMINGQIGLATGSPGALARLVEEMLTALVLVMLGVATPSLLKQLSIALESGGAITGADQAMHVYGVAFAIIIDILIGVLVAVIIMMAIGSGFAAQAGMALGLPGGVGLAISRIVTTFAISLVGFGLISLANRVIIALLS